MQWTTCFLTNQINFVSTRDKQESKLFNFELKAWQASAYKVHCTAQFRLKNHEEQKMSFAATFLSQEKSFFQEVKGRFSL